MKTVVTINKQNSIKLERFENELKIGERHTSFEVFLKAMLAECDIEFIMSYLVERKAELENLLSVVPTGPNNKQTFEDFTEFVKIMIENLHVMRKNEQFQALAMDLLKNLSVTSERNELIENLLIETYTKQLFRLEENENLRTLMVMIINKLARGNNPRIQELFMKTLIPYVKSLKDKEVIEEWYRFVIQNIDINVLASEANSRLEKHNQNYGFTTLPKGCVAVSMNDEGSIYVLEVPKSQFRVKLYDVPYEDVGHPRLIFVIHFNQKRQVVTKVYCAAIKANDVLNEDTTLYKYPYSNVYNNGEVCWSSYPTDFASIGMLPTLFLSSANNNHLCQDIRLRFEKNENQQFDDTQLTSLEVKLKKFLY